MKNGGLKARCTLAPESLMLASALVCQGGYIAAMVPGSRTPFATPLLFLVLQSCVDCVGG